MFVDETNKYAEEVFLTKPNVTHSRITKWNPVTISEMKIFLGLTMHMGTTRLPRIQDYWESDKLFDLRCFSDYMERDRYLIILKCLHFSRNPAENEPTPDDPLFKIRPVVDYFNAKMNEIYCPGKELSLDEPMLLWGGELVFGQNIKNKRQKYGVILYTLAEPSGIIQKFAVYSGTLDDGDRNHSEKVVMHLMNEEFDLGHSLYIHNNSYELSLRLLARNTHSTGILCRDAQNIPPEVGQAKLHTGQTICRYSNGVMIGKWCDKRDITYISTEYENTIRYGDRQNFGKQKPLPLLNYNKRMGGIDRTDRLTAYYPFARKTVPWYKKLGVHVLQLLLLNSHLLFNKREAQMSFYDFRLQVIRHLLPRDVQTLPGNVNLNTQDFEEEVQSVQ